MLDEAQYPRYSNVRYDSIIAWSIDNLSSITFIVTGSEVGVLRGFLKLDDPSSPLYSRYRREILVNKSTREQSLGFLKAGMKELKASITPGELEEAIDTLNGVVGWLTYYGYYRGVRKLAHSKALSMVLSEGAKLVASELEKVIAPSRARYIAILKAIAHGASTWSEIKAYVTAKTGAITSSRLSALLKNLIRYSYIDKAEDKYKITDPLVKHTVLNLL